jgi:hypothetical protein
MARLSARLQEKASSPVTIRRGGLSVGTYATFGAKILKVTDGQGNTKIERADGDFTLPAANYNFGSGVVEPLSGDIFEVVFGGVTKQFQVMPVGGSEPAWRYCDAFQIDVRCHTKFIGIV